LFYAHEHSQQDQNGIYQLYQHKGRVIAAGKGLPTALIQ
jgi:hypothetical protein